MNIILWIAQLLLAVVFIGAGAMKALRYQQVRRQMTWVRDVPPALVRLIGVCELLGGIGLIIPAVTHVMPWLTPAAAVGLGLIQALAFAFHGRRREWQVVPVNLGLLALAAFAAYGRLLISPL